MDKQDFQKQDFMEILVRLPCACREKCFFLQLELLLLAVRNLF